MNNIDLIPAPRSTCQQDDSQLVTLGPDTALCAGPGTEGVERWLRTTLSASYGLGLPPAVANSGCTITLGINDALAPEEYRLGVDSDGAKITGGSAKGVFWGAQTLRQLLGPEAFRRAPLTQEPPRLPMMQIEDAPRFAWRGFMLDVARHFMPKDVVLRYIDLLAAHKLNVLHLHLTDDQGWRIEIKRYPRLTEVGAWRTRTKVGMISSQVWDERPHGGYYTQDDIREIAAYASERHITVVPEIDIPGHSQAAIAAYPQLGNRDVIDTARLEVFTTWGVNPNVLSPTDDTLRFYEHVLEEVLALFPQESSPFIHIGGDECPKDQWRASATAQERIKELGLADEDELQSWFIRHFATWLATRGRRLIGWDEILEGGLADGATVSSWRGYSGGIAAARAGHDVVMCPEQHVYLDYRQDAHPDEPVPIAYVRSLEDVYRFEPVPPQLTSEQARHIIGTQANMWTEAYDSVRGVDYMVFPRLAAFAEVAWSTLPAPDQRDYTGFGTRMHAHYARLDALGVEYRPPAGPHPWQRRPGIPGRPIEGTPPTQ
ncbi:beta-N-acetylhexosaminidase [Streptomyces sp. bgisy031]|uniref:beta-N-acetylhexosaminidase n=1 Tax=Streptomyces sp. bgisy031 TaxID=3413772 RepID=UPI003D71A7BD